MSFTGTIPKFDKVVVSKFLNGHWNFHKQMGERGYVGFIYVIYDKVMNRAYLGKKLYYGTGQVNKGVESNWRRYMSSSEVLKAHFKERPLSEFEFYCVEEYRTKGTLSYAESWSLFYVEAPTSKIFYNTMIEKVCWKVTEPISEAHKTRLVELLERLENGVG
jgi:hypothetical protein